MADELKGMIYDIQRFSVHDGPGIRTIVFLKGCPLKCLWCHSPESISFGNVLSWFEIRCIGVEKCGRCIPACPENAIRVGKQVSPHQDDTYINVIEVDRNKCTNCGGCEKACTSKALFLTGVYYTVDEVMERVLKDRSYYQKSGGGVTVSGGEPLSQIDFTLELLKRVKQEGIHTALDTTGFAKWETLEKTVPYVDLYLYDIKHTDSEEHKVLCNVPNELIIENVYKLARAGGKLQLRAVIIPGFNDNPQHFEKLARICCDIRDSLQVLQLLPYHKLGAVKHQRLSQDNPMPDIDPPTDEHMEDIKEYFESFGLPVRIH
jgi:pyruvate formate lyase activating enzyme